jgi:hypothetical protein
MGGGTIGLFAGLVLGFCVGSYWTTVLYAVLIGAASGVVANLLALPAEIVHRHEMKPREQSSFSPIILEVGAPVTRSAGRENAASPEAT